MSDAAPATTLDDAALRAWPLPAHDDDGDKEARGRVLVIGGSSALGGAVVLAGVAAMRAGAGKVSVATSSTLAPLLALAFPEARVIALDEDADGGLALRDEVFDKRVDALLVGPGMNDAPATALAALTAIRRSADAKLVVDAGAMEVLRDAAASGDVAAHGARIVVTPHAGELAHLTGRDKQAIAEDPVAAARAQAQAWGVTVVLKGARTVVAAPDGRCWRHDGGNIGLAVSGSGDTLAGIIAGLAARGATLEQAAAWGVVLHARAGDVLAARIGRVGFLAREIPGEIPSLIERLQAPDAGGRVGFRFDD